MNVPKYYCPEPSGKVMFLMYSPCVNSASVWSYNISKANSHDNLSPTCRIELVGLIVYIHPHSVRKAPCIVGSTACDPV